MNLKAKLYILKNHTFLLLGPSPFEHWFESYLCIIEGSLHFCDIAFGSSFVYLSLSPFPLFSLSRAAAAAPAMCAASAASAPLCARPRALPRSTVAFPDLALATACPRHVVRGLPEPCFAADRRRSDSSTTSCFR
jgi:hypothetical protein